MFIGINSYAPIKFPQLLSPNPLYLSTLSLWCTLWYNFIVNVVVILSMVAYDGQQCYNNHEPIKIQKFVFKKIHVMLNFLKCLIFILLQLFLKSLLLSSICNEFYLYFDSSSPSTAWCHSYTLFLFFSYQFSYLFCLELFPF